MKYCNTVFSGASSEVLSEGMTRAPVVTMPTVVHAAHLKKWIEEPQRIDYLREVFSSTTRFGKLQKVDATVAGRHVYLRFSCSTGDAMGMNMVGKGINTVMADLQQNHFPELRLVSLSGNMCIDKKPSALNWINGRGKSVVAGVTLTGDVVRKVLKTTPAAMAELNVTKNLVGSAMAGSIGGFNAHASNVVTACFLAMGQDPAQNVESSTCITQMELINNGEDLYVSVTMPSIEVGTIGGGTGLPAAKACLSMALGNIPQENPGDGARALARVVAGTVLAGEISLLAALSSGHLISAHMDLNRKPSTTI
ncbi:hydroxymethylglutaryl-coenzyme A reductase [Sphaeroforma arctica JP610]|uniref:hydroxymethylglutaryl-CoA reductase (NADPH) n=1 Tax=Sphaeroforma arctica JP610 TaxID=667725 RepID=A0A0L0FB01_9EUKA|nr:hydroxymethylglutaryl-coenzyme A reductase [Sphaeroforma arctica JP610]KNC73882.1 hydroxymethylglutaryl-coenzyme A reductase [Sphaeroforma arctica JP610]|eukprot:XP_014147784.1 hydroxymethylglutaryl-coenzyme A reductase [Sphaeroforma arctica JP610]